jgi:hypothetical protein
MLVESKCALTMALASSSPNWNMSVAPFSSVQFRKKDCTVTVVGLAKKTPLWTGESPTASAATRHPDQLREILTRVPPWAGVGGE